jgi:hypothetical protein
MSTSPETEFDLELHFLPAWAKESPRVNRYEKFEGAPQRTSDRGDRRDRPPRRPDGRPGGPGRGDAARRGRPPGRGPQRGGRDFGGHEQRQSQEQKAPPVPLPEINVAFVPDDHGVDSLARQIRMTGRAYPLFEIAQMVLAKPERHSVTMTVKRKADNSILQPLFTCALDETLWLSEDDALRHALEKHFNMFYQAERTQVEPPKGVYTFVAQCGMSGMVLGPPNYHDYQNQLRKLHAERFSKMPFEVFKSRVKIVKDEAVVKKWIEDQSWRTEYACLNVPEPLKLPNREEVEKHFRQTHGPIIVKAVDSARLTGTQSRNIRDRQLSRLLRQRWEEQKRFPLQVATVLSQQFATRGLQFFKVNKTVTHVSVARPHFLDLEMTPVSDGIRRIVDYINTHAKCTHRQLVEALAPSPASPVVSPKSPDLPPSETPAETATTPAVAADSSQEPSPEMTSVMTDLHWLIHQGHVIEFANGVLETAKKPAPRPTKPAKNAEGAAASEPASSAPSAESLASEAAVSDVAEPLPPSPDAPAAVAEPVVPTESEAASELEGSGESGPMPGQG